MEERRANGSGTLIKTSTGLYIAKWQFHGKTYTRSTKCYDRKEATTKLNEYVRPFLESNNIAVLENLEAKVRTIRQTETTVEDLEREKKRVRLADVAESFFDDVNVDAVTESTRTHYTLTYNKFLEWMKQNHPSISFADEVTGDIATEFLTSIRKRLKSGSYNQYVIILKRIYSVVVSKVNVWTEFKTKRMTDKSERIALTKKQLALVLKYVEGDRNIQLITTLAAFTGLRYSDCCLIKWCNIDFERKIIHLVPLKTKRTGKEVVIPIHPVLEKLLIEHKRTDAHMTEYVSGFNAMNYKKSLLRDRLAKVLTDCGIKTHSGDYIGMHVFRHTFVSLCANAGVPIAIVMNIVGHSCTQMVYRYYHQDNSIALKAFNNISMES